MLHVSHAREGRLGFVAATRGMSILLLLFAMLFAAGCKPAATDRVPAGKSALERVVSSGKIRCSYLIYSNYFRKDPNTGALSGIFYDVMEEIGKNSSLKIEWVEEVGYENIFAGLDAGRYDVFAAGLWPNTSRAKAAFFTVPICYSIITTWGRPDEKRFSEDLTAIDSPSVRIATIDGAMEDIIARTDFPKASCVSLPQLSPFTQNFLNITSRKADVTFAEPSVVAEFLRTNPGALKQIAPDRPLRIFGNSLVVRKGEIELKEFMDVALRELLYSGRIEKILERYDAGPNLFPRVAIPYRLK